MKFLVFSSLLVLANGAQAACVSKYVQEGSTLAWTAFKTPKKVGVGAKFDKFTITSKPAATIQAAITGSTFTVDSSSVNSGNPARDKKIVDNFFTSAAKPIKIEGKVEKVEKDTATVSFTINGVTKSVPMKVAVVEKMATLSGSINVLDFSMSKELAALNEACKALHEGKTWADVDLKLDAKFDVSCK